MLKPLCINGFSVFDREKIYPLSVYQKYYKRYFARVQAGSLKREKFKLWQYEAVRKRDDCLAGNLTLDKLSEWLERSMPNRSPNNGVIF